MDWYNIHFLNIELFWLSFVIVGLLGLLVFRSSIELKLPASIIRTISQRQYRHPQFELLNDIVNRKHKKYDSRRRAGCFFFYVVLILLISASLAQPYRAGKQLPEPPRYRDIMFVVDTSVSMNLRDYVVKDQRIARMEMMKNVLSHFIQQLQGNRIGVVAFSEQAYTLVPLTTDYRLLNTQINRLESATLTGRTNDLSHALLYTFKKLNTAEQPDEEENAKPVIVLLTGANRPRRDIDPRAVARFFRENNYTLHTIAIGAPGYEAEEKNTISLIYHPANFRLLNEIATEAGGLFFWAKNTESLKQAIQVVQQSSERKVQVQARYIELPLYHWPLLASLVWILFWQLIPVAEILLVRFRKANI